MAKFRDNLKPKTKAVCKYRKGESGRARHKRRLQFNVSEFLDEAIAWSDERGIVLSVSNEAHHWRFSRGKTLVEWWPSSAKCVVNLQWNNGIHVHDWIQLQEVLISKFPRADQ